jgi:hypothetical protein
MKKLILFLLLFSFSLSLFAQKGAFIGVRIIPQSAWILNQDDFDSELFDFAAPFSMAFALGGGYMFNDVLGTEVQLLYSPQGQKYIYDENNASIQIHNDYFKIPVLFRFRSEGEKVAFLFNIGPEFGFLTSSKVTSSENDLPEQFQGSTKEYYQNFEFSATMGFGTSISLGSKLQLDLLVQLDYGLTEIESNYGKEQLFDYQGDGRASANNAVAGFSVGLNYAFGGNTNTDRQKPAAE